MKKDFTILVLVLVVGVISGMLVYQSFEQFVRAVQANHPYCLFFANFTMCIYS